MKEFQFKIEGMMPLSKLIGHGLKSVSFRKAKHGQIDVIYLLLCNGVTLKIEADINTVSPSSWEEIGTLKFQIIENTEYNDNLIVLNDYWEEIKSLEILKLIESGEGGGIMAESGIVITNGKNEELIIVCGSYPMTLQMKSSFYNADFEPEYDLTDYKREVYVR